MKLRILFLFVLLMLLASGAAAEQLTCIVREGQYVNVRNQPSSQAAARGILHAGDIIDIIPSEIRNGFFKTTYKDHTAYVSVKYFEIAVGEDFVIQANGRVRMRKSPGGSANGFIKPGTRVHVIAWQYGSDGAKWARCAGGSYISAAYLLPAP